MTLYTKLYGFVTWCGGGWTWMFAVSDKNRRLLARSVDVLVAAESRRQSLDTESALVAALVTM